MMSKVFYIILGILIIAVSALYLWPVKPKDFFALYPKRDKPAKELKTFFSRPVKHVDVDGVRWTYYSGGSGDTTILFAHGMGGAYQLWWQQIIYFEPHYRVISYTLPETVDNLDDTAEGIKAILHKEKVNKFIVVGTSMGGYIAQYLTHIWSERILKAVFSNTFPPNKLIEQKNARLAKILPWVPTVLIARAGEKQLREKLLPAAHNDTLLASFLPTMPFSKKQFLNRYKVLTDKFFPQPDQYVYKRIPVLIIESANDPLVEKPLREKLKALYAGARVENFGNEGHFPYITATERFNKVLESFFHAQNPYVDAEKTLNAYFDARTKADTAALSRIFVSQARLWHQTAEGVESIGLDDYLQYVAKEGPRQARTEIIDGGINGTLASFAVKFYYNDATYTDHLQLVHQGNQWRIVSKAFEKIN